MIVACWFLAVLASMVSADPWWVKTLTIAIVSATALTLVRMNQDPLE